MNKPTPQEIFEHYAEMGTKARAIYGIKPDHFMEMITSHIAQEKLLGEIEMFVTEVERFADNNSYLRLIKDSQEMLEMLKTRNEVK